MAVSRQVSPEVIRVLKESFVVGNTFRLAGKLDRKLYREVNIVLENAGGVWSRKEQCHVFSGDPNTALRAVMESGKSVNEQQLYQTFFTPRAIAERMASELRVAGHEVLEPSCGQGAIVKACLKFGAARVDCCELDHRNIREMMDELTAANLHDQVTVVERDFLQWRPAQTYERIVMNPPFSKGQAVKHIMHATTWLRQNGQLASIIPASMEVKKQLASFWRPLGGCSFDDLPPNSFRESGTSVDTCLFLAHRIC